MEVRRKFSDIMNFMNYFNEKNRKLSVNQVFDNFKIIFLDKHDYFRKAHIKTNRLKKKSSRNNENYVRYAPQKIVCARQKNSKFFQSCLDMRARATK